MAITNSPTHYGSIAKFFHWTTALLIITLIPLGLIANKAPFSTDAELASKAWLFSLHKTLGISLFAVALLRILWAATQPKPAPLHPDRRAETFLADLVHWLLYASLVLAPLTGWASHAASIGFAPIWWPLGQSLPLVPKSADLSEAIGALHILFVRLLMVSLLLHIAGAVKHAVVDRDATLARMLPGQPQVPPLLPAAHSRIPAVMAAVVLALAVAVGAGSGLLRRETGTNTQGPVAQGGNWALAEGTISITVKQLGQGVSGSFGAWTAETTRRGAVLVQIDTASLALGSVTAQALGPDFFDAAAFPKATFTADIAQTDGQLVAIGTLDLKGVRLPLTLPFSLEIDGGIARMSAQTQLDRRDFAMGAAYPDEVSVGFAVAVDIKVEATRR